VIAAGRRQAVLDQAQKEHPKLKTIQGDIGSDTGRIALFQKVTKDFPDVNVLINNAGIVSPSKAALKDTIASDWESHKQVLEINLTGNVHLAILFIPHLATKQNALIANVTSILAFFPIASMSTYCATKAALHSFTISLRHQLKDTSIKVVEIAPPAVDTELGKGLNGMNVEVYGDDTIKQLLEGAAEISYEGKYIRASRDELDATSDYVNSLVEGH
jgi:uncharacterized oxidoreductase